MWTYDVVLWDRVAVSACSTRRWSCCVRPPPRPARLSELCERTGLPRATAHRLAVGLEAHRLLRATPTAAGAPARRSASSPTARRSAAHRRRGRPAPAARPHGREHPALPPRRGRPRLRGRRRARQRPARHGPGRRPRLPARGLRRQGPRGLVGRPGVRRSTTGSSPRSAAAAGRRASPSVRPGWRASRRRCARRAARSSPRSRCRDPSTASDAVPARAGPSPSSPPRANSVAGARSAAGARLPRFLGPAGVGVDEAVEPERGDATDDERQPDRTPRARVDEAQGAGEATRAAGIAGQRGGAEQEADRSDEDRAREVAVAAADAGDRAPPRA